MKDCCCSAEKVCAILVESTMRNISVKLLLNFDGWLERRCRLKIFLFSALVAFFSTEQNCLDNISRGHYAEHSVTLFGIWASS